MPSYLLAGGRGGSEVGVDESGGLVGGGVDPIQGKGEGDARTADGGVAGGEEALRHIVSSLTSLTHAFRVLGIVRNMPRKMFRVFCELLCRT